MTDFFISILIKNLDPKTVSEKSDMNTNTRRKNFFFAIYKCDDINGSIHSSKFHVELKEADIVPGHKKKPKKITDLLVFFEIFPRFTKNA